MGKVIHIDCDCFFAAVEERDNPELVHRPVAVGGSAAARGVLATCNYKAREYGLHSAMPTAVALRRCPDLVLLPPRFDVYREVSGKIMAILQDYCHTLERVSVDEAYLAVDNTQSATAIARSIRQAVKDEAGITVSAGVSINKFLAKVASDWRKPDGLFVIPPDHVAAFVAGLPVGKIPGVGRSTLLRLQQLGVEDCADLQQFERAFLMQRFGAFGKRLYDFSRGVDDRPVCPDRTRKSLSVEHTYPVNLYDQHSCLNALPALIGKLQKRYKKLATEYTIDKLFVKVRFADFSITTIEAGSPGVNELLYASLLQRAWQRRAMPVRLIGVGVGLQEQGAEQLALFEP